jgi:hypothetical protein
MVVDSTTSHFIHAPHLTYLGLSSDAHNFNILNRTTTTTTPIYTRPTMKFQILFLLASAIATSGDVIPLTICGDGDDRILSKDVRQGRLNSGCTAWLISESVFLTAKHCEGNTHVDFLFSWNQARMWISMRWNFPRIVRAVRNKYRVGIGLLDA